jgi:hypothetical protein
MMDLRKKLIEWIRSTYVYDPPNTYKATMGDTADAVLADVLLANGVVVREKGENLKADTPSLFECSKCGWCDFDTYTADTGVYNFCPNCGADMRKEQKR